MSLIADFQHKARCFYQKDDLLSCLRVLCSDGSSAMILYRLSVFFRNLYLAPLAWLCSWFNKVLNGCVIGRRADFGPGFVIMHPAGIVINGGVKGGDKVVLESGVVIGAARNGIPVKVPMMGDDIFIGTGAKILGGISIGNHVTIGANAVVIRDVLDYQTVVGVPAKPIEGDHHAGI
jgi:serine O-acetyltransferase